MIEDRIPTMIKVCEKCGEQFTIYLGEAVSTTCSDCREPESTFEEGIKGYIKSKRDWGENWTLISQGSGGCSHHFIIRVDIPKLPDDRVHSTTSKPTISPTSRSVTIVSPSVIPP